MGILVARQFFKNQKGQSLVEAVGAVALVAVVVVVLSTLAIGSVRNAYFARQQSVASFYGQQGIELTRSIRDQNLPNSISDYSIAGCPGGGCTKWSDLWGVDINSSGDLFKITNGGATLQSIASENLGEIFSGGFTRTVRIFDDSGSCGGDYTKIKRVLVKVTWKDNKSELVTCLTKIENLKS